MEEFYLSRDVLCKEWDRETYIVKANSYEEALKKFIEANKFDFKDIENNDIKFKENVPIYETAEYINPKNKASVEIYGNNGTVLWDNYYNINNYGK